MDRGWYEELERVSGVFADIGGVTTTHINHLTPQVLDIDDLYASMQARGIEMIDDIQGPPRWDGQDVLLRQTSFRALSEPRRFREPDGTVVDGALRVRFGEVEARGIALTPVGRDRYDKLVAEVDSRLQAEPTARRQSVAAQVWAKGLPATERELCVQGLAFFTYELAPDTQRDLQAAERDALVAGEVTPLVDAGLVVPEPVVYEDFLPRSAAGIFASNLSSSGSMDADQGGAARDLNWMSDQIGIQVSVPADVYAAEVAQSVARVQQTLLTPRLSPEGAES